MRDQPRDERLDVHRLVVVRDEVASASRMLDQVRELMLSRDDLALRVFRDGLDRGEGEPSAHLRAPSGAQTTADVERDAGLDVRRVPVRIELEEAADKRIDHSGLTFGGVEVRAGDPREAPRDDRVEGVEQDAQRGAVRPPPMQPHEVGEQRVTLRGSRRECVEACEQRVRAVDASERRKTRAVPDEHASNRSLGDRAS